LSEKEFKDRHRGGLSRGRFINAKQKERTPSRWEMEKLRRSGFTDSPRTSGFYWALQTQG
jgi:hypothetical protein